MRGRPCYRPSAAVNSPAADDVLPAGLRSRRFVHPLAVGRQRSGTNEGPRPTLRWQNPPRAGDICSCSSTTAFGLGCGSPRRDPSGRVARGSVAPRKMACPPVRDGGTYLRVQGHRLAQSGGAAWSLPLSIGRQDPPSCFDRRPLALMRNASLGSGSRCFWLCLFRTECSGSYWGHCPTAPPMNMVCWSPSLSSASH
jgi:hypothetical protein